MSYIFQKISLLQFKPTSLGFSTYEWNCSFYKNLPSVIVFTKSWKFSIPSNLHLVHITCMMALWRHSYSIDLPKILRCNENDWRHVKSRAFRLLASGAFAFRNWRPAWTVIWQIWLHRENDTIPLGWLRGWYPRVSPLSSIFPMIGRSCLAHPRPRLFRAFSGSMWASFASWSGAGACADLGVFGKLFRKNTGRMPYFSLPKIHHLRVTAKGLV